MTSRLNKFYSIMEWQVCTKCKGEHKYKQTNKIQTQKLMKPITLITKVKATTWHEEKLVYHRPDPCSHYKQRGFCHHFQSQLHFYVTAISAPFFARLTAKELGTFLHCCPRHWRYPRVFLWTFLVTSQPHIVALKSCIKGYKISYKASIKSRLHMARITVPTIREIKEKEIKQ